MTGVIIAILVSGIIITLVGHASWLLIAAIWHAIFGPNDAGLGLSRESRQSENRFQDDQHAFLRVIDYLLYRGLISSQEFETIRNKLAELRRLEAMPQPMEVTKPMQASGPTEEAEDETLTETVEVAEVPIMAQPIAVPRVISEDSIAAVVEVKQGSTLSKAEIIRSFLATHNIRWGELVAGLLIVICSIGLVVSLWNTLITSHRVVPSLIFLAGNGAIFAAGLYTLSRWKLRHTSRAVLVIATLLVPLSVLAGLAAIGKPTESVRLDDPVTLLTLFAATAIYLLMLMKGAKALVGTPYAGPMALSVAGPTALLPMLPTVWRMFSTNVGWSISFGSISVLVAMMGLVYKRVQKPRSMGMTTSRNCLLTMSVGVFSMATSVGYAVFFVRAQPGTLLPIAVATIPALIGLAGCGEVLANQARRATHAMVGRIVSILALAICFAMLPAAIGSEPWTWTWAIVLSTCTLVVGCLLRGPRWIAAATFPIGTGVVTASPVWMRQVPWADLPLWMKLMSGEAMVASAAVALSIFVSCKWIRSEGVARWIRYASFAWAAVTLLIATGLAIAPMPLLGTIPSGIVTAVLAVGMIATAFLATIPMANRSLVSYVAIGSVVILWASVLKPLVLFVPDPIAEMQTWLLAGLGLSATVLLLAEVTLLAKRQSTNAGKVWSHAGIASAMLTAIAACFAATSDWHFATWTLAGVTALVYWASTIFSASKWGPSTTVLRLSQLASVAGTIVFGYGAYRSELFAATSWTSGQAWWCWGVLFASVSIIWIVIRRFAVFHRRSAVMLQHSPASPALMVDGAAMLIGVLSMGMGVTVSYVDLLADVFGTSLLSAANSAIFPLLCFAVVGIALIGNHRQKGSGPLFWLTGAVSHFSFSSLVVWCSIQVIGNFATEPAVRLILTTTLAAGLAQLPNLPFSRKGALNKMESASWWPFATALALVMVASIVLLSEHWINPLVDGRIADRLPTLSVASWWIVVSAALWWIGQRMKPNSERGSIASGVSAFLTPAAALISTAALSLSHPIVWFQVAVIFSFVWVVANQILCRRPQFAVSQLAENRSLQVILFAGAVSAIAAITKIVMDIPELSVVLGMASFILSGIAVCLVCFVGWPIGNGGQAESSLFSRAVRLPWPIGLSLFAGQMAWMARTIGFLPSLWQIHFVVATWLIGCIASLILYQKRGTWIHLIHSLATCFTAVSIAILLRSNGQVAMECLGLIACVLVGILVAIHSHNTKLVARHRRLTRGLPWFTLLAGGYLIIGIASQRFGAGNVEGTMAVLWLSGWIVAWRWLCVQRTGPQAPAGERAAGSWAGSGEGGFPADSEVFLLLALIAVCESVSQVLFQNQTRLPLASDSHWWVRLSAYFVAAASTVLRGDRRMVWQAAMAIVLGVAASMAARAAEHFSLSDERRIMVAVLAIGFTLAAIIYQLKPLWKGAFVASRTLRVARPVRMATLARASEHLTAAVAVVSIAVSVLMIFMELDRATIRMTIVGVAMVGIAYFELSELTSQRRLRHFAVQVALITIGLWASVVDSAHLLPWLVGSMQWLVAGVISTATLLLAVPKFLGDTINERWRPALRVGAIVSGTATIASLLAMLMMEAVVRRDGGIDEISRPLIIGIGVMLVFLSLLTAWIAIATGPRFSLGPTLLLSDRQRQGLIVAAQAIAAMAWLHLFLCKADLAFLGLRAYWPYIVMLISFVSVGATEWAKRQGDEVLSSTLAPTALYLPLIPAIGFWLSGGLIGQGEWSWMFDGGKVPYALLLSIGAAYYVGLSLLWKRSMPRVTAIVLGNAALWVMLVQTPGWSFLAHPQAWLIPPAVCVLVVAHQYRDRLGKTFASAIRYGMTLVIYVSSTADMLLQQIGTSISGPIVLIVLALIGMLAGVILRVRPFLYLGACFVFLGAASMVRHAQVSINAVWPWWAFGISTGVMLLAGLMWIEKNKPRLRQYANTLSNWDG
ncbi:hypothetical protein Q31b_03430 [Novipirellula aureliae]|uniref:Uncharacterized protein n=1 Tax=Novipirellula aureliae TaxID=2527966 RepID=A0A5C6E878_9BACT|nr:hypothetical protein [Novipirellula aureliae]TWU45172.1 hypothetical protein Q31b_03430 [Novipirellula aureliae]